MQLIHDSILDTIHLIRFFTNHVTTSVQFIWRVYTRSYLLYPIFLINPKSRDISHLDHGISLTEKQGLSLKSCYVMLLASIPTQRLYDSIWRFFCQTSRFYIYFNEKKQAVGFLFRSWFDPNTRFLIRSHVFSY